MSTPVFVDPEISTQANGAQNPRVPVPFPKDPYEAIRKAYLVETNTEFESFEDPVETETPESPHTVASPTSLSDSTPPTRHDEESEGSGTSGARSTPLDFTTQLSPDHPLTHITPTLDPFLRRTARMAVRVPPVMSPGLSASIAEVATISDSTFLVDDEEEDDEAVEESSDSDSESEDAEDKGPTAGDEGPAAGDEGLAAGMRAPPLGLGYEALRHQEIASREGQMPNVFEVGQGFGFVPDPERPKRVSALRQPTLTTWIDPEVDRVYIDVPAYPPPTPPV
ncbi:hypothetical protein Tco_1289036 [Tanacetum coccineum]